MKLVRLMQNLLVVSLCLAFVPNCRADSQLDAILHRIEAKSASLKSLKGTVTVYQVQGSTRISSSGTFCLKKPNFALIVVKGKQLNSTVFADSKQVLTFLDSNQYMTQAPDPKGRNISLMWALQIGIFFDAPTMVSQFAGMKMAHAGRETVGGETFDLLSLDDSTSSAKLFVDRSGIVRRLVLKEGVASGTTTLGAEISNIRENPDLAPSDLAFQIPTTAKEYKQPDYTAKLIGVGQLAEKFDLTGLDQDRITLDSAGAGKKAILVNFWFYG